MGRGGGTVEKLVSTSSCQVRGHDNMYINSPDWKQKVTQVNLIYFRIYKL